MGDVYSTSFSVSTLYSQQPDRVIEIVKLLISNGTDAYTKRIEMRILRPTYYRNCHPTTMENKSKVLKVLSNRNK